MNNYWNCHKCRKYVPLAHPAALEFYVSHSSCSVHVSTPVYYEGKRVYVFGKPGDSALSAVPLPVEGYTCDLDLGPMEELAYSSAQNAERVK